jgi:predicted nuclease with TOPRIM domain
MCKDCTQNPNAEEYGMTKEEQLQKDLELQAETIGYLRERIAELEKENKALGERCLQLQKDKGNLTDENNELKAQIEKMKCWCNCKNYLSCLEECCRKNISFEKGICYNCKKWEIKEK